MEKKLRVTPEGRYYSERSGITADGKKWKTWTTRTIYGNQLVFWVHVNHKNKFGSTTFKHIKECAEYIAKF